jgi:WD40 repeat protein
MVEAKRKMLMKKILLLVAFVSFTLGSMQVAPNGAIRIRMDYFHEYNGSLSCFATATEGRQTYVISGFNSGHINVSLMDGSKIFEVKHGARITAVEGVTNAGLWFVSGASDGTIKVWDFKRGLVGGFACDSSIHTIKLINFQDGGTWIMAGTNFKTYIFNLFDGIFGLSNDNGCRVKWRHSVACNVISTVETEQDKICILAGLENGVVEIWSLDGELLQEVETTLQECGDNRIVGLASCNLQGKIYIIAGSESGTVTTWILGDDIKRSFHYKDYLGNATAEYGITDVRLRSFSFKKMSNGENFLLSRHNTHLYLFNLTNFLQDQDAIHCGFLTNKFPTFDCRCEVLFTTNKHENFLAVGVAIDPENSTRSMVIINRVRFS